MTVSPFNQPIGASPTVHPSSAAIMTNTLSGGVTVASLTSGRATSGVSSGFRDFGHPLYFAATTDPLLTTSISGNRNNLTAGEQLRVPAGAAPANGSDGHMCIVEPDGTEYDFWQASISGSTLHATNASKQSISGPGNDGFATAAHFGLLAGVIRPEELIAGTINHALFFTLPGCSSANDFGFGVTHPTNGDCDYVYPAAGGDQIRTGANQLPMGGRLQLNMTDAQIAALSVPTWKKTICTALKNYGGYCGDTSGSNNIAFQFLSGQGSVSFGLPEPLCTYADAQGLPSISKFEGVYTWDLASGIDWATFLRVLAPPSP
jgi:hypothetical protein